MKLYTEEQLHNTVIAVSNYLDDINLGRAQEKIEKHLKALQPIELPSDEEIKDKSFNKFIQSNARTCFEEGAKWIKEQILGKEDKTFKQKSKWTKV
jgi:hypothetical protein